MTAHDKTRLIGKVANGYYADPKGSVFVYRKPLVLSGGFACVYFFIIFSAAEARYSEPVIIAISFVPALRSACDIALSRSVHDVQRTPCSMAKRVS